MTREQIKAMLPEGTEDKVVTAILNAMHDEIKPYKDAAEQAKTDLETKVAEMAEINKKASTADEKARAYEELQAKYDADIRAANERAADLEFGQLIDTALRDKGARNLKAAKALMDMDTLKASNNRDSDIKAAIEALASAEDSAFIFEAAPPTTGGRTRVTIGAPTGGGSGDEGVAKMRAAMGLPTKQ